MNIKLIKQCGFVGLLGVALLAPTKLHAGGRSGQLVTEFKPAKIHDLGGVASGEMVVEVCRKCQVVMLMRVEIGGRGASVPFTSRCPACGSEDTYFGIAQKAAAEAN